MTGGPSKASLVGRADESSRLKRLFDLARQGHGQAVVIEGEAGMGKTRLLDEVLAGGAGVGVRVFRGQAEELDCRRPFGAIADCLGISRHSADPRRAAIAGHLVGDRRGHAGSVASVESGAAPPYGESQLADALVALVEDDCARGPVAIALDDLQWADGETLLVLHRLNRLVPQLPLFLVGACRPSPRPAPLLRLMQSQAERGSQPLALGPLSPAAVDSLLAEIVGTTPGPRLARQVAAAGGNPFFVTELVAALRASGSIATTDDGAEIASVALPPALKVTILHRMSFLSSTTLDLLRMASILGSAFSVRDLTLVVDSSTRALAPMLREAIEAGVLAEAGPRMAFRHDLLREALYEDVPLSLRMSLHHDVATALSRGGAPTVAVAEHFLRGAVKGDAMATAWLQRAADEVTVQAPTVAADLLNRAIDLFEPGPERDLVMADRVVSLDSAGRVGEAEAICVDLLTRHQDPRTEVRLRLSLSRLFSNSGRLEQALEQSARALEIVGLSPAQQARALANASTLQVWIPDLDRAEEMARQAREAGTQAGDEIACAVSAFTLSSTALRRGQLEDAIAWATRATVAGDSQPERRMAQGWQHLRQAANLALGSALLSSDRLEDAEAVLGVVRRETEQFGFQRLLVVAGRCLMIRHFLGGEWDDAIAEFDGIVDLCDDIENPAGSLVDAASVRSIIAVHRNDPAQAASLLPAADTPRDLGMGCWRAQARALLAEATGRPDLATEILCQAWDRSARTETAGDFPAVGPDVVRLVRSGDPGRARDVTVAVCAVAGANPAVATMSGAALRCRGLLDDDADLLLQARAAYVAGGRPFEGALACEEAAELLARSGRGHEARPLFDQATGVYHQLRATWNINRAGARMRALGIRRGSRGVRDRPTAGWEALTPSELSVVELVASGLSNPEAADRLFLSRSTVKAHVSSALTKLGMSSRVELAREAAERRVGPPARLDRA
ncbi:MAG: hypothetical protein QOE57_2165 [Acidimicrobiaceae bacterium]|nr:hypothetical protein [Acidimicrobiaceae bacterium]